MELRMPAIGTQAALPVEWPAKGFLGTGTPGGTRTPDPLLRRQPLCPLSYRRKSETESTAAKEAYHTACG